MSDQSDQQPVVSVVVPAFNAEKHLSATLESIGAQSIADIEILVVDDCSADGTEALVQRVARWDPRVRYLRTASNFGGPAGPRNVGVDAARADWIAFCDADDLWHPRKLETQLACARARGVEFVCTQVRHFHGESPAAAAAWNPSPSAAPVMLARMLLKNRIATSSVLCRRALLQRAGGFDADRRLIAVEDFDLWLRLLAIDRTEMVCLESPLVDYRQAPGSLSRQKWAQARRVALVWRRHFQRTGHGWVFPFAVPVLMLSYISIWLWTRVRHSRT